MIEKQGGAETKICSLLTLVLGYMGHMGIGRHSDKDKFSEGGRGGKWKNILFNQKHKRYYFSQKVEKTYYIGRPVGDRHPVLPSLPGAHDGTQDSNFRSVFLYHGFFENISHGSLTFKT